jgi:hypothetical protein
MAAPRVFVSILAPSQFFALDQDIQLSDFLAESVVHAVGRITSSLLPRWCELTCDAFPELPSKHPSCSDEIRHLSALGDISTAAISTAARGKYGRRIGFVCIDNIPDLQTVAVILALTRSGVYDRELNDIIAHGQLERFMCSSCPGSITLRGPYKSNLLSGHSSLAKGLHHMRAQVSNIQNGPRRLHELNLWGAAMHSRFGVATSPMLTPRLIASAGMSMPLPLDVMPRLIDDWDLDQYVIGSLDFTALVNVIASQHTALTDHIASYLQWWDSCTSQSCPSELVFSKSDADFNKFRGFLAAKGFYADDFSLSASSSSRSTDADTLSDSSY